jgi:hypothetical protein
MREISPSCLISKIDPVKTRLTENDLFELYLLRLNEDDFKKACNPVSLNPNAPSETGDAVVDEWEREFWQKHGTK